MRTLWGKDMLCESDTAYLWKFIVYTGNNLSCSQYFPFEAIYGLQDTIQNRVIINEWPL